MNKNFYLPIYDLKTTIDFINEFKSSFLNLMQAKYQIVEIDLPILCNVNSKFSNYFSNVRTINFDNVSNLEIYEVVSDYDYLIRYFYYKYNPEETQILLFKFNEIIRDLNVIENTIETLIYNFELKIKEENRNKIFLKTICENFWKLINESLKQNNVLKINELPKINFFEFKKIRNKLISYSHKKAFYEFIKIKKCCAIIFDDKNFNKINKRKSLIGFDPNNTISIYWWNEYMNEVLEILTITIRPDFNIINNINRENINSSFFENNKLLEIMQSDKIAISCSVKLFFDHLMTIFLNKKSTKELPSKINEMI